MIHHRSINMLDKCVVTQIINAKPECEYAFYEAFLAISFLKSRSTKK